jgi:hypothetical protein
MLMLRVQLPRVYDCTAAVPNGGARHKKTGADLKAEGVKSGYPDIVIDLPCGWFHGMRVEMKRRNGVPSDVSEDQRAWGELLNARGFLTVIGWGADHALEQIRMYHELGPFDWSKCRIDTVSTFALSGYEISPRPRPLTARDDIQ